MWSPNLPSTHLSRLTAAALTLLCCLVYAVLGASPARAADDYPYRTDRSPATDPWGMTKGQCVSFVAWRLAQEHHPVAARNGWGDADRWDDRARALHLPVSPRPVVGSVAQWDAGERSVYYLGARPVGTFRAGPQGHVAYVRGVYPDGSVLIEQYNLLGSQRYSVMRVRAPRYLLVG